MKKLIAAITTGLIAVALVVVGAAAPASAHQAKLTGVAVCNSDTGSATITWTLDNDYNEVLNVTASDNTTIPVGTTVAATGGGADTTKQFVQNISAPAANVSVTTTLDYKWSGDGFTQNGPSVKVTVPSTCTIPIPKDASASVTDTPAACGAAESASENTPATNANWAAPSVSGNTWTAVATAVSGHQFASAGTFGHLSSNNTVDTFTVHLHSATNPNDCKDASAAVVLTAATCQSAETVALGAITDATWGTLTYPTTNSYSVTATAISGYEFSNGQTTLTLTGSLGVELSGHPCEDYIIVAWHMPSWVDSTTPTWPQQIYVHQEESTPDLSALDSYLAETCGVQYQVDIYYNSPTTASLITGGYLNGPNNPPEDLISGGWGVAYKLVQGPACATPVVPTETDSCGNGGSITITPAEGVTYYVNGTAVDTSGGTAVVTVGDGTTTVTAVAQGGYLLSGYPAGGWTFNIDTDCTATYDSSGTCTAINGNSFEDVTLDLDNPSGASATFAVTAPDSTVTDYTVPAGTTEAEDVGSVSSAGGTFVVSINGGTPFNVVIDSFTGCIPTALAGDPFVTPATCNSDRHASNDNASITVDEEAGLSYTITGPAGFTTLTGLTGTGGDTVVVTDAPPGAYVVSVVALPGYTLNLQNPDSWPFNLTVAPTLCDFGVTITAASCNPPVDITSGTYSATAGEYSATVEVLGTINTEANPDVVYTATNTSTLVQTVLTNGGSTSVADGTYTVKVTLSAQGVTDGYVLNSNVNFGPYTFTSFCPPTLAAWNAGATSTNTTCSSSDTGTITLSHPAGQADEVDYVVTNDATSHVVYSGTDSTDTVLHVAPGNYTVTATPHNAGDGIVGPAGSAPGDSGPFLITVVGTSALDCGNLAFTGGTIAWLGFVLAGGMLFLGFALLYMRRRRDRTAE